MTLQEILDAARNDFLADKNTPKLWSDDTLARYANEAEREACRRADLLIDSTTIAVCSIAVSANTASYALHGKIRRVLEAKLASQPVPLFLKTKGELDELYPEWRNETGTPVYVIPNPTTVRLVPTPTATDTLALEVVRLPLADMSLEDPDATPEIPEAYHFDLIDWICHLAYSKQDAETMDLEKAKLHEARFTAKFGPRPSALSETNRVRSPRNRGMRFKEFGFPY
ncbi:MAG: hypothetical protein K8I29_19540 [Alphaproteobacteria bacterium]|uniref:Uncharacterized protein n=1 Tax=Candidatus Nitrobium versatile TaxID=2884831 RepID=A0A953SFB2_9BACT|nr:hypothetical protein [Candidatus Nitrobium versatile]